MESQKFVYCADCGALWYMTESGSSDIVDFKRVKRSQYHKLQHSSNVPSMHCCSYVQKGVCDSTTLLRIPRSHYQHGVEEGPFRHNPFKPKEKGIDTENGDPKEIKWVPKEAPEFEPTMDNAHLRCTKCGALWIAEKPTIKEATITFHKIKYRTGYETPAWEQRYADVCSYIPCGAACGIATVTTLPTKTYESFPTLPSQKDSSPEQHPLIAAYASICQTLIDKGHPPTEFKGTPERCMRALSDMIWSIERIKREVERYKKAMFTTDANDMVFVGPIHSAGLCPHHLLPVLYEAYVAYIPNGKCIGLSKIPRIVKALSKQPILQETLARAIAEEFNEIDGCAGSAVHLTGQHTCMSARGVREHDARAVITVTLGHFRDNVTTRSEFMSLVSQSKQERR